VLLVMLAGCLTPIEKSEQDRTHVVPAAAKAHKNPAETTRPKEIEEKKIYHVVGENETLWRIAKAYGIELDEIVKANNLKDTKVQVGQKLFMPGATETVEVEKYRPPKTGSKFIRNEKFGYPCIGTIVAGFGSARGDHKLEGLDFSVVRGRKIVASRTGEVVLVARKFPGYGLVVILQHGPTYRTFYGYLSETSVRVGDAVARGEVIGTGGVAPRTGKPECPV